MTDLTLWVTIVALVALLLGAISITLRFSQQREEQRAQRVMFEVQSRAESEQAAQFRALIDLQQRMMRELVERTTWAGPDRRLPDDRVTVDGTHEPTSHVVREISHSLNTPLSQIEIALALVSASGNLTADDRGALARAATSVAVLKSFVQAFRIVSGGDMATEFGGDEDLSELIQRASALLGIPEDNVDLNLPTELPHRATLVLAMFTPLLENAIECSPPHEVFVSGGATAAAMTLTVENSIEGALDPRTFDRGFSTKSDHEGLGLAVVQRLTRSVPGARLAHEVGDERVMFNITLPLSTRRVS